MTTSNIIEKVFKKTKDGLSIYADVIMPSKASTAEQNSIPVLVWWHGGGLLQGTRKGTAPHLQKASEKHKLIVVSADYRLAPQVKMPDILSDAGDILHWIQSKEFLDDVTKGKANQNKVFVSGSSAGGWLALLTSSGLGFKECGISSPPPKPQGCIALYPITDITDSFWTTKQHPVSYFPRIIDGEKELGENLNPKSEILSYSALDSSRSVFYHYMIQEALLPSLLLEGTGIKPETFSIAKALSENKIELPPTLLTHGSIDDKVVPRQSTDIYEVAQQKGIKTIELLIEDNKDHLYDRDPKEEMDEMYNFIAKYSI